MSAQMGQRYCRPVEKKNSVRNGILFEKREYAFRFLFLPRYILKGNVVRVIPLHKEILQNRTEVHRRKKLLHAFVAAIVKHCDFKQL